MILVIKIVKLVIWGILHYKVRGGVYVELGMVFIGDWGYLTLPRILKMKRPASSEAV